MHNALLARIEELKWDHCRNRAFVFGDPHINFVGLQGHCRCQVGNTGLSLVYATFSMQTHVNVIIKKMPCATAFTHAIL